MFKWLKEKYKEHKRYKELLREENLDTMLWMLNKEVWREHNHQRWIKKLAEHEQFHKDFNALNKGDKHMRPFNLEEAKKNPELKMRAHGCNGVEVRFVGTTFNGYPVVEGPSRGEIFVAHEHTLFHPPRKVTKWVNVFKGSCQDPYTGGMFDTEAEARNGGIMRCLSYIATTSITYEE